MRKLRAAVVGVLLALPAALVLPGAVPAAAALTACPGTITLNQAFNVSVSPLDNSSGNTVTITGSNFPALTTFNSGVTVYFSNGSGSQAVQWSGFTVGNNGTTLTGTAPGGGYSGAIEVCLSGDSYQALTQSYSFKPVVSSVPGHATEGSSITLGGNFVPNGGAQVHFSCGTVNASSVGRTALNVTVPGYCPGQISVTQTALTGGGSLNGPLSAQSLAITPTASPASGSTYPGQTVTVTGSGFGGSGSVTIAGAGANVTGWSDGQVSFQAPDGSEGGAISINAPGGSASAGSVSIYPHISGLSPSTAKDGDTVTINGQDFGSSPGTVTLGGQALDASNLSGWGMDKIAFSVPAGAVPGAVGVTTADGRGAVNSANLSLVPVISTVDPASASPGSYVTITGSTFGQSGGSVTIGGKPAQIADWADTAIIAVVPSGASTGKLIVNSGYGQSVTWGKTFTVLSGGSSTGSGSGSGGYSSYTNSGTLNVKPNYGFLPLPKAPPGVAFHITAPASDVKPGAAVDMTVNLAINNKPVAGATITFQVASSPGSDTALSAPSVVTDQNGIAHVTLKTSKKAGQTIVIAHSGAFADQIRIVSLAPTASLGTTILKTTSTLDPHVLIPFIGALGLAVLLLLGTVILQFVVHRRQRLPAPVAAAAEPAPATEAMAEPKPRKPRAARAPRAPRAPKPKVVVEQRLEPEPIALDLAAGAEDIAPVIPLRSDAAEQRITRTRARARKAD